MPGLYVRIACGHIRRSVHKTARSRERYIIRQSPEITQGIVCPDQGDKYKKWLVQIAIPEAEYSCYWTIDCIWCRQLLQNGTHTDVSIST